MKQEQFKFHGLQTDNNLPWKTCRFNQVKYAWL